MKTFTADSMDQALLLVKRAYGANGVILHTRAFKQGGLLGIGAKRVVEVTAADGRQLGQRYRKQAAQSPRAQAVAVAPAASARAPRSAAVLPPTRASAPAMADANAGDLIRRTYAAAWSDAVSTTPAPPASTPSPTPVQAPMPQSAAPASVTVSPAPTPPAPPVRIVQPPAPNYRVEEELTQVRRMVTQMMRQQKAAAPGATGRPAADPVDDLPDALATQYLKLLEQEVAEELAEEIVAKVRKEIGTDQLADEDACARAVHEEIAKRLPSDPDAGRLAATDDGRPRTIALVGPTGVGKTTTLAKLAATFKLKQGKKVGLITMDTFRIAAVEQLRTYAKIIGLPLKVVNTADELARACAEFQAEGLDAILIDTAGRSQRASEKLGELGQILEAAAPHEVHLVLSSTVNQKVLLEIVERFSRIEVDRIIFTKLDEAVTCGVLLNVARRVGKRVSYVTTGQEVPHQIEPGSSDRLASLVMGEESGSR